LSIYILFLATHFWAGTHSYVAAAVLVFLISIILCQIYYTAAAAAAAAAAALFTSIQICFEHHGLN
jgi:hypothetical protein